jgi:hypothetical protein
MWADRVQTQHQMQPNTSPQVCHRFRATCHACTNLARELNPTDISRAEADARARCCTSWQPAWLAGTHASRSSAPPVTRQGWRITLEHARGCGKAASALTWAATPAATPTLADVDTLQHRGRVAANERCFQVAQHKFSCADIPAVAFQYEETSKLPEVAKRQLTRLLVRAWPWGIHGEY